MSISQFKFLLGVVILSIGFISCTPQESIATQTPGSTAVLWPYQTPTQVLLPISGTAADLNLPTSTPATYTVVSGDTFFSIAARFNISLDALMAANPDISARLLTPGTVLALPVAGSGTQATALATPTAVAVTIAQTNCLASLAGELWCFVLVDNPLEHSAENLIGLVQLAAPDGTVLASLQANPPINLLKPGERLPLIAYTAEPPQGWIQAHGQLLSAYALTLDTDYYLSAQIQEAEFVFSADKLSVSASGRVAMEDGNAGTIWVLAVAYDASGNPVGFRRWESEGQTEFAIDVYSLGPKIDHVDLLVEARR